MNSTLESIVIDPEIRANELNHFIVDEEFRSRLRTLSADELAGLERLLLENGCLSPLIVWDETSALLDGHHRLSLCQKHNIPYEIKRVSFASREEALLWVLRHQRDKRNSTDGEKYAMTREIRDLMLARGRERQAHGQTAPGKTLLSNIDKSAESGVPAVNSSHAVTSCSTLLPNIDKSDSHSTQQEMAHELGWSHSKVAQADYIWQHGDEKVKDKLVKGDLSVNQAYREAKKRHGKLERAVEREIHPTAAPLTNDRFRLILGDIALVGHQIGDNALDWIVTDPPYPREYLHVYDALGKFAAAKLKPGGSLICMAGQSYFPDVLAALTPHLCYQWLLAYLTPGGQSAQLWGRKVNTFWKPLIWLVKGEYAGNWIGDVCRSKPNDNDKCFHGWGQSESGMADILQRFTKPGDLICDPFCGGGSTGVAAVRLHRKFIGIDINPACVNTTSARIAKMIEKDQSWKSEQNAQGGATIASA